MRWTLLVACIACGRLNSDPGPDPKPDAKRTSNGMDASGPVNDAGVMDSGMPNVPDAIAAQPDLSQH